MDTLRPNIASNGFTLIEISIVLVIIGLIVGGILVGRDMIAAAQVRAQISQIENYETAVNTFKLKYNCLPGDCPDATTYFGTTDAGGHAIINGDGDGIINGYTNFTGGCWADPANRVFDLVNANWLYWWSNDPCNLHTEWSSVFEHLSAAGLVDLGSYDVTSTASNHPGIGYPMQKVDGGGGVVIGWEPQMSYVKAGHKIRLGAMPLVDSSSTPNQEVFTSGVSAIASQAIDVKMDDGKPYSGTVVVTGPQYLGRMPGGGGGDFTSPPIGTCADGSLTTNNYLVGTPPGGTYPNCALEIKTNF